MNRYARKRIELGDESLGDLRITGTVLGNDVGGWVQSLETAFGIEAVEEAEGISLRRRAR